MCFSASASFTASALLGLVGYQTLKLVKKRDQLPLALLPSLFALQQCAEGVLWVYLGEHRQTDVTTLLAQFVYIFLAYLFFLVWLPLSSLALESVPWRRRIMQVFVGAALFCAALNLDKLLQGEIVVQIVRSSLHYPETNWIRGIPYILIICTPMLFSSRPRVWWLGALGLISAAVCYYFYYWTFASVWCFFAAFISITIYRIVRGLNETTETQQSRLANLPQERVQ